MSVIPNEGHGKITVPGLLQRKSSAALSQSQKITCLTAYDYPTARLFDEAGVDVLLVGDSLGMVVLGYDSTLPVTIDEMLHHTRAVRRGTRRALVVVDMPYGSFHTDAAESLRNAVRFVKEAGAEAVKVEGGERRLELIMRLTEAEIPVMGHVGLTPLPTQRNNCYAMRTPSKLLERLPSSLKLYLANLLRKSLASCTSQRLVSALVRIATARFWSCTTC
jgi:3-methyl-2-oxobutanoate hydroxymethyltransferase